MKRKCVWMAALVLWGSISGAIPSVQASSEEGNVLTHSLLEQALEPLLSETMEADHIPGAAVVVTMGDRIVFSKGYGYADVEQKTPVNPERTIMRVGSLTKSVTAAAVLQLGEQGKLGLDQDINRYLTGFKVPFYRGLPITLHHLLTHTAGLDEAIYDIQASSEKQAISAGKYLERYLDKQPPIREPGVEFAYSNAGLGLAGYLVEQVSGSTLHDYLTRSLFQPLRMPSAGLNFPGGNPDMSKSYQYQNGRYQEIPYSHIHMPGAGAVSVVPEEWAHFMMALLNGGSYQGQQVLKSTTVEEMQAKQFSEHPNVEGVGYGLYRSRLESGLLSLWHTGDVDGYSSRMELIPQWKLGIFVVTNAESAGSSLHGLVTDAVIRLLPVTDAGKEPVIAADDQLEQYARSYSMELGPQHGWGKWLRWLGSKSFEVKSEGAALTIRGVFPDNGGSRETRTYIPLGKGLFQDGIKGDTVWFHRADGVWRMTFTQGVTIDERLSLLSRPTTQLVIYAGIGLLWISLFLAALTLPLLRLLLRKKQKAPGHVAFISTSLTIYLTGQLLYGNSVIIQGYPAWYAWGFSSLPFLAAAAAIHLGFRTIRSHRLKTGQPRYTLYGRYCVVFLCLCYTCFLFYWNMLSVHYS
jgi:CubicO group peptidase (beta-lactamase class C family)